MDNVEEFLVRRPPTALRPLLGMTLLVVEDSRFACEAVRMLCMRSGARVRRADSLTSAMKHLSIYRPTAIIVDVGLPDGSGLTLIRQLAQATPRIDVILGTSGDPDMADDVIAAGGDGFLPKPIASLSDFQQAILSHLPANRQPQGPRMLSGEQVAPDRIAYREDLEYAARVLKQDQGGDTLDYVAGFIIGIAGSAGDTDLACMASRLIRDRRRGDATDGPLNSLTDMVTARLKTASGF
ncbi:Response regulator receiver domain-containing protein [Loktanella sp. DSM 29012]|uniref:response regulator n=1 Tax=Loktanella sp. DSM 29012 TaxID=1881056 RepID=UPI0008B21DE0|nr:response regulator [Loktanella sp. DSM 29012]SEQ62905.1 Response regulator receiver domain-containing protein [Loktanella sp. DSM 29012]